MLDRAAGLERDEAHVRRWIEEAPAVEKMRNAGYEDLADAVELLKRARRTAA
jgi:hypothetical protein